MIKNKILIILLVSIFHQFLTTQIIFAQDNNKKNLEEEVRKAEIVLSAARKAVYGEKSSSEIQTIKLIISGISTNKLEYTLKNQSFSSREMTEKDRNSYLLKLPNLARIENEIARTVSGKDSKSKIAFIINGNDYDLKSESILDGLKVDSGFNINKFKNLGKIFNSQDTVGLSRITGNVLFRDFKSELFPFLLTSFDDEIKLKYIGKSVVNKRRTNVLEVIVNESASSGSIKKRFFFDLESHVLVMSTSELSNEFAETQNRIFYSDYKNISGINIPSKIRTEEIKKLKKNISTSQLDIQNATEYKISNMAVEEFLVNLSLDNKPFFVDKKKKN